MGFGDIVSNVFDPADVFGYRGSKNVSQANAALDDAYKAAEDAASQNAGLYKQYMDKVNSNYGNQAGLYDQPRVGARGTVLSWPCLLETRTGAPSHSTRMRG